MPAAIPIPSLADVIAKVSALRGNLLAIESVYKQDSKVCVRGVCAEHGEFTAQLNKTLDPGLKGCPRCNKTKRAEQVSESLFTSLVDRAKAVHGDRYAYLAVEYNAAGRRMYRAFCEDHGEFVMSIENHLNAKHGCARCGSVATGGSRRVPEAEWLARAEAKHGDIYSDYRLFYKNDAAYFKLRCSLHGEFEISAKSHALAGAGCIKCFREIRAKEILKLDDNHFISNARALGLEVLGVSGAGSSRKVHINCEKHGEYLMRPSDLQKGCRCNRCANGSYGSSLTRVFTEILDELGIEYVTEARLLEDRYRWDVLIPSKNLAIELDGIFWHSTAIQTDPSKMKRKADRAREYGYTQINIFEDELNNKTSIIKALIANRLGLRLAAPLGARECMVVTAPASTARAFLDKHHIQGFARGSEYLGLENRHGELVSVLVLEHRACGRTGKRSSTESQITRYASSHSVRGGFSKLIQHVARAKPELAKLTTYSDCRLFSGDMYKAAGFTKISEGRPDYVYVEKGERIHKRSRQKSYFAEMARRGLAVYDPTKTEEELAKMNKLYRLYDRGRIKWELDLSK